MNLQHTDHYLITPLRDCPELLTPAAAWFSSKWGIPLEAYQESMEACIHASHSGSSAKTFSLSQASPAELRQRAVPQWYLVHNGQVKNEPSQNEQSQNKHAQNGHALLGLGEIIAGCGIIENDFHKRTDLAPNLCALYVEEPYRNQGIAGQLLNFVCRDMAQFGIPVLYLITDHTSFYERYDWEFYTMVKEDEGGMTRMYRHVFSEKLPDTPSSR